MARLAFQNGTVILPDRLLPGGTVFIDDDRIVSVGAGDDGRADEVVDLAGGSVAPELPGAEAFVRACRARGVRCNAGHSHATFDEAEAAVGWGVRHVDHLFCAMSDRARLRQSQPFPMRGGLLEATLTFDELTTE